MSLQPGFRECGDCTTPVLCKASDYCHGHDVGIMRGVTASTPCPERLGGQVHHYPFTRGGRLVTMPGPDVPGFGGAACLVMLGLCWTVRKPMHLVAPRELNPATPPTMCPECEYEHFLDLRRAKDQLVAVG